MEYAVNVAINIVSQTRTAMMLANKAKNISVHLFHCNMKALSILAAVVNIAGVYVKILTNLL